MPEHSLRPGLCGRRATLAGARRVGNARPQGPGAPVDERYIKGLVGIAQAMVDATEWNRDHAEASTVSLLSRSGSAEGDTGGTG
jgi:hypothetical protein